MANVIYGEDPDDWVPESNNVGTDPLTINDLDDRWIQFYVERIYEQIERLLSQDRE